MNSHERRMYLLLARIPDDRQIQVWDKRPGNAYGGKRLAKLADLDAERVIVKLECGEVVAHVPPAFATGVVSTRRTCRTST